MIYTVTNHVIYATHVNMKIKNIINLILHTPISYFLIKNKTDTGNKNKKFVLFH